MFELKENIKGGKATYKTLLNISKDKEKLIFEFYSSNYSFNSVSDKFNDPIYNGDVTEVFLQLNKKNCYLELEIAPNGTLFIGQIYNELDNPKLTLLDNIGVIGFTQAQAGNLMSKIIIDTTKFDINENPKFNAFRIETEKKQTNRHLFALNPTMCGSFHRPQSFVYLKDYIND